MTKIRFVPKTDTPEPAAKPPKSAPADRQVEDVPADAPGFDLQTEDDATAAKTGKKGGRSGLGRMG